MENQDISSSPPPPPHQQRKKRVGGEWIVVPKNTTHHNNLAKPGTQMSQPSVQHTNGKATMASTDESVTELTL